METNQQNQTKQERRELRHQEKLERQERAIKKQRVRKFTIYAVVVALIGLVLWGIIWSARNSGSLIDITKACVQHGRLGMHIHPVLRIVINGKDEIIPANIGIPSPSCMRPTHTHDTTGTIHIESKEVRDFQLKEFFAVWDKPFSREQILDYKADEKHRIRVTINGVETDQFENIVMRDGDQIVIFYEEVQ